MTTLPSIKQKTCRVCKIEFRPSNSLQRVCGYKCAANYASELKQKALRRENKVKLNDLKSKSEHLNELQEIFNRYIRLRDKDLPCISCGTTKDVQYHAGHFMGVGAHPNLRFNEYNVNKQCGKSCNKELHGNLLRYRIGLIVKYGSKIVEELESNLSRPVHYSIPEIIELKSFYKQKITELKKI